MGNTLELMTQEEADNYNNPDFFDYLIQPGSKPGHTLPPPIPEEELESSRGDIEVPTYDPYTFWKPPLEEDKHSTLKYANFRRNVELNHNFSRNKMNVKNLSWRDKPAKRAKNRVNRIINKENCIVTPMGRKQNVYQTMDKPVDMYDAVQKWYSQCLDYQGSQKNPPNFNQVRNFTQLAWKNNDGVGCAEGSCGDINFVVCDYSNGNNRNQFRRNVDKTKCYPR